MARNFYEDDEIIVTKPGYNTEISPKLEDQETVHGDVSFVDGMIIRSLPILNSQLKTIREYVNEKIIIYSSELNTQVSAATNEWNSLNSKLQASIKEPILPGLIYILTATLTGSVLSARRSLPIRFLTPTIFGITAYGYYMPKTFRQTTTKLVEWENNNVPEVYNQQSEILKELTTLGSKVEETFCTSRKIMESNIHNARVYINELLE